jgi:hypothetical protein
VAAAWSERRSAIAPFILGGNVMRAYVQTSGLLFGLIAIGHLYRVFRHWPADLAGHVVPLWLSWIGLVLAGGLSLWALRLLRGMRSPAYTLGRSRAWE